MLASIYIGAALGQHKVVQSVPTYEYSIVPPHPSDRQIQIWDMDLQQIIQARRGSSDLLGCDGAQRPVS